MKTINKFLVISLVLVIIVEIAFYVLLQVQKASFVQSIFKKNQVSVTTSSSTLSPTVTRCYSPKEYFSMQQEKYAKRRINNPHINENAQLFLQYAEDVPQSNTILIQTIQGIIDKLEKKPNNITITLVDDKGDFVEIFTISLEDNKNRVLDKREGDSKQSTIDVLETGMKLRHTYQVNLFSGQSNYYVEILQ